MKSQVITIFTDGSSRGNPGPGGWAAVVVGAGDAPAHMQVKELGGRESMTTNNRMEIMAAVQALRYVGTSTDTAPVHLHTDSLYLINGITKWVKGWSRNGWMTSTKEPVVNKDLWMDLLEAVQGLQVSWKYVGGHVGVVGNERCDRIATAYADERALSLYDGTLAGYDIPHILDISVDEGQVSAKKSSSSRSRAAAYSYVSSVGGTIQIHRTWAECEKRVKGVKGARFKKALDAPEEALIMGEFSS